MPKLLGRIARLEIIGSSGTERIGTLTAKTLTIANAPIDATSPPMAGDANLLWQESLQGGKQVSFSGDGVFADSAGERELRRVANLGDPTARFNIDVPRYGIFNGRYRVESLDVSGDTEGAVQFSLSLVSTEAVTLMRHYDITPSVQSLEITEGGASASYDLVLSIAVAAGRKVRVDIDEEPSGPLGLTPASRIEFAAGATRETITVLMPANRISKDERYTITHTIHDVDTTDSNYDGMVIDPVEILVRNA